jgi:hypothetical protein
MLFGSVWLGRLSQILISTIMPTTAQTCGVCEKSMDDPKAKHYRCIWQITVKYKDGVPVTINRDPKTNTFPCRCTANLEFHGYKYKDSLMRHIAETGAKSRVSKTMLFCYHC